MRLKICLAVASAVALCVPAPAQEAPAASQPAAQSGSLKIVVLEGEGAKNNIRSKVAVAPAVEVRDEADKPVQGAEVVFQLPMVGPSGVFDGWVKTQTVRTDEGGRARVTGYTPNDEEGRFNIKVTATSGTRTATAVIAQSNVAGPGGGAMSSGRSGWWKVVAVIGTGAAIGGIIAATRNGDEVAAPVTNPVIIGAGPVSVSGPR